MLSQERRICIEKDLKLSREPVSAATLARQYGVSRQVIVGDIALLRASGCQIQATPRGYVFANGQQTGITATIACRHSKEQMKKELYLVTDLGGSLLDVIVEHPIYGQLVGQLHMHSRYDADQFLRAVNNKNAQLLSRVTDGIHLHTILCPDQATLQRIITALDEAGILYQPGTEEGES